MLSGTTLVFELIRFHARLNPERPGLVAFESSVRELSYAAIARRVDAATSAFAQAGLVPGQRIGIHCRDRVLQVIVIIAVGRIAEATFVFSPDGAFAPGSIDLLLSDHTGRTDKVKTILIDADALVASTAEPRGPIASALPGNSTWWFTGRDPVELGGNALRARIARRSLAKGTGSASRWLCAASLQTELGLSAVIECLSAGGLAVLSNGTFESDVEPIALYETDHLLIDAASAPGYLRIFDTPSRIHAPVRAAIIAGRAFDEPSVQRMKQHVSPDTIVSLDLPETGAFAACSDWQIGKPQRYWPLPGVELRIAASGNIAIRCDGTVQADADGWFESSFQGSLAPDGALVLAPGAPS